MVTAIVDAALQIKNLLRDNWAAGNTRGVSPTFSTGWYDGNKSGVAQVTVTEPEDGVRLRAMSATGAAQFRDGSVVVNCWAPEGITVLGSTVDSGGAKKLADTMRTETDRIITTNQNYFTGGLGHIEVGPVRFMVESDRKPVIYRWHMVINFDWWKTP